MRSLWNNFPSNPLSCSITWLSETFTLLVKMFQDCSLPKCQKCWTKLVKLGVWGELKKYTPYYIKNCSYYENNKKWLRVKSWNLSQRTLWRILIKSKPSYVPLKATLCTCSVHFAWVFLLCLWNMHTHIHGLVNTQLLSYSHLVKGAISKCFREMQSLEKRSSCNLLYQNACLL